MNDTDMEQMGPQNYLYGCELKAGKDVVFNPEEDPYEHQLSLRMVCVDPSTKDELHVVEVEGRDTEGQAVKAVLATLKPSSLPSVCLAGFEITPPAVFRLKSGSGPIHISGQHLVLIDGDQSFDDDDDDEEEEEEPVVKPSKRSAHAITPKAQKRMKMEEKDDDDEDEDDDDDDDDDGDDYEDEESEDEETPVKTRKTPAKAQPSSQNGKTPSTPAGKPNVKAKTPDVKPKADKKGQTPKTPQTPKAILSIDELKAKMLASVEKGVKLPNVEAKFENFLKNGLRVSDPKTIQDLWKWRQTVKDRK